MATRWFARTGLLVCTASEGESVCSVQRVDGSMKVFRSIGSFLELGWDGRPNSGREKVLQLNH